MSEKEPRSMCEAAFVLANDKGVQSGGRVRSQRRSARVMPSLMRMQDAQSSLVYTQTDTG